MTRKELTEALPTLLAAHGLELAAWDDITALVLGDDPTLGDPNDMVDEGAVMQAITYHAEALAEALDA